MYADEFSDSQHPTVEPLGRPAPLLCVWWPSQFEPTVSMRAFLEFLRFLYTGRTSTMDPLTALDVLSLTKGEYGSGGESACTASSWRYSWFSHVMTRRICRDFSSVDYATVARCGRPLFHHRTTHGRRYPAGCGGRPPLRDRLCRSCDLGQCWWSPLRDVINGTDQRYRPITSTNGTNQ